MTPLNCFFRKIEAGIVDQELGARLVKLVEEYEAEYAKRSAKADALRLAAQDAADDELKIAAREADLAARHVEAQLNWLKTQKTFEDALDARRAEGTAPLWLKDPRKSAIVSAARALLTRDNTELASPFNVYYMARNIRAQAHGMMTGLIEGMRPAAFGFDTRTKTQLEVLQAIKNKDHIGSPEAKAFARQWNEATEFLRQAFVDAGGALPKRENWGLPNPVHDSAKVRSVPKEEWVDFILKRLDKNDMIDFDTGRPLLPVKRRQLLEEMYDSVATNGLEDGPTAAFAGQKALHRRRAESRFISFKSAEDWIEYNERFGSGASVFDVMMNHVEAMADDIAMLRVLGPNPDATMRFIFSSFDREAARMTRQASGADPKAAAQAYKDNIKIEAYIRSGKRAIENLYAEITGANKVPVNLEAAHVMGETRALLTGSQMGSAILSSIVDPALASAVATFNDTPVMGVIGRAVAGMADNSFELNAAQLGVVADAATMRIQQNDRFMGERIRTGIFARLANGVIQASGLRRWTGVLRSAFALETMAAAANRLALGYDELTPSFRDSLGRYGIDRAGWETIRSAVPTETKPGARFLTSADIRGIGTEDARRLGDRWQMLIDTEMDFAVIEGDPMTRAFIQGKSQPGTLEGEVRRSIGQYKAFPVTFALMHFGRAFARGWDGQRLSHAALTFTAMWAMGMVAMQAKEIAKGRDPITMDPTDPKGIRAWGAAALQGGGLGIFGDLLFMDQTRNGNTWAAVLAGPTMAATEKVLGDFLLANLGRAWKGQETHFAGDALYAAAGLVPGANLWYLRTAFQRSVVDQLALMIDERTPQRFQRIEREAEKTWGQRFWWEPGRTEPRRAPDPAAAFGG